LRIDESPGLIFPEGRRLRFDAGQSIAHQVVQPEVEQLQTVGHAPLTLLGAFALGGGIHGFRFGRFLLALFGARRSLD